MSLKLKHITLKNVYAFLQGESRIILDFFESLPVHIQEQVNYRISLVQEKSPECLEKKECIKCGCSIPDLFYANKQCDGKCYPVMMDEKEWEIFKSNSKSKSDQENQIDTNTHQLNID